MPPLMYAQRKKAAATEAHSIAISDRGARFGGRSFGIVGHAVLHREMRPTLTLAALGCALLPMPATALADGPMLLEHSRAQ